MNTRRAIFIVFILQALLIPTMDAKSVIIGFNGEIDHNNFADANFSWVFG